MFNRKQPDMSAVDWRNDRDVRKAEVRVAALEIRLPELQRAAESADAEAAPLAVTVEELDALADAGRDVSERGDLEALRKDLGAARRRAVVARVDARDCATELDQARVALASAQHAAREKARQTASQAILSDLEALGDTLVGAAQINARLRATMDLAEVTFGHDDLGGILPGQRNLGEIRNLFTEILVPGQTAVNGINETTLGTYLALLDRLGIGKPLAEARKHAATVGV